MIKFDKLKIITKISYIRLINKDKFIKNEINGHIESWTYKCDSPFSLLIKKNRKDDELVIEFTGKILLDKYPDLIGMDNIRLCLENINDHHICKLDINGILSDSYVTKCDVTIDVHCTDLERLATQIKENICNHKKYMCKRTRENIEITNCVTTRNLKTRCIIYDKYNEINRPGNREFLRHVKNKDEMLNYFKGRIRFELNLNSKQLIRQHLGIADTNLSSVLNSAKNPIIDFFSKILINETEGPTSINSLRDYERLLLINQCEYDMSKVEAIVRNYSSPKTSIKQIMAPYQRIARMENSGTDGVLDELKRMLNESP